MISSFFRRKSLIGKPDESQNEEGKSPKSPRTPTDKNSIVCGQHNMEARQICECTGDPVCQKCIANHAGIDHKKVAIADIQQTFPQTLTKKVNEVDGFHRNYRQSEQGQFFDDYNEFFENCREQVNQIKAYYDSQEPWTKQGPPLEKFIQGKNLLINLKDEYNQKRTKSTKDFIKFYKAYIRYCKGVDKYKEQMFTAGTGHNFKSLYEREKIRASMMHHVNVNFKKTFMPENAMETSSKPKPKKPPTPEPGDEKAPFPNTLRREDIPVRLQPFVMPEQSFDEETKFYLPKIQEDFDVVESNTFKGAKGPVRDLIKMGLYEFASCDESGQVIIWNTKTNKMKGFSLQSIKSSIIEPIYCMCLTEPKGKFLVCGMRKGHVLLYNRSKGGKKVFEYLTKKMADILDVVNLERLGHRFFLIQDNSYYIRMYSADYLYYDQPERQRVRPLLEIPQKEMNDDKDIYMGDGKLAELVSTEFIGNKERNITFIMSCCATLRRVNMYVIDGIVERMFCFFQNRIIWKYQQLRRVNFDHSPTSMIELSHNRVAVACGLDIEIIDVHSENRARLVLSSHSERIRSLTMMSRRTKILAKSKTHGNQTLIQNTDFLMSSGDDMEVRIWKIPPPLTRKKMRKMTEDGKETDEQEYCILKIETRHKEPINSLLYLHESIASGSREGVVKVYDLDMQLKKAEPKDKD